MTQLRIDDFVTFIYLLAIATFSLIAFTIFAIVPRPDKTRPVDTNLRVSVGWQEPRSDTIQFSPVYQSSGIRSHPPTPVGNLASLRTRQGGLGPYLEDMPRYNAPAA